MDHISIIIVHYNTEQDTKECLESLIKIKADHFKYSVVVVDNASKKPLKLSRKWTNNNFEVVRSESNLGFTGGNNLGITYAIEKYNSEYVLLLNNDTTVHPDFLTHLYKKLSSHQPGGLVCPKIYFSPGREFHDGYSQKQSGKVIWYAGASIDWPNIVGFHRGVDEVDQGQFDQLKQTDYATGCCVLISREVLETVGMFDDNFFLYLEDVDFSVRAKRAGYELLFCPQSIIWHKNAGSSEGAGSKMHQYYQTRNRVWFGLKHGRARYRLVTLRLALQFLFKGNDVEQKAVVHALTGNLGKEPIL